MVLRFVMCSFIRFVMIVSIQIVIVPTVVAQSLAPALESARARLLQNDLPGALAHYARIDANDPRWPAKVEDLLRHHLLHGSPVEAWRLTQLLRRVKKPVPFLNDYESLAVFMAGACPLALPADDTARGHLLKAATYRFARTRLSGSAIDPRRDRTVHSIHLAPGLVHNLTDIPRAELLKGQGCRFTRPDDLSPTRTARAELNELMIYLDLNRDLNSALIQRFLVMTRAFQLATELKDTALEAKLAQALDAEPAPPWTDLPDAERKLLFHRRFKGTKLTVIPPELRERAQEIALQILEPTTTTVTTAVTTTPAPAPTAAAVATAAAADWLGLIDLDRLPLPRRLRLLTRLSLAEGDANRGWVLFELARAHHESGDAVKALGLLRRLMVENEEPVPPEMDPAVISLATRIFVEHRFDERMRGAIQAALPARLWTQLLNEALLRLALNGRRTDYERLASMPSMQQPSSSLQQPLSSLLLRELARRDFVAFSRRFTSLPRGPSTDRSLFLLGGRIAAQLPELDTLTLRSLRPFLKNLTTALAQHRSQPVVNSQRNEEVSDLVQALQAMDATDPEWSKGGQTVRQGILRVGVARWRRADRLPNPFELQVPSSLPLRFLVEMPDSIVERGWKISTSVP